MAPRILGRNINLSKRKEIFVTATFLGFWLYRCHGTKAYTTMLRPAGSTVCGVPGGLL